MATKKIIVILGPTASGKSELAVKIAKKFHGEIISADSRQVYKWLNIGTEKVKGKWKNFQAPSSKLQVHNIFVYKNIVHHCIDFVSPKKIYTAGDYKKCAQKAIKDIWSREKIPIICGGTGFYIDVALGKIALPEIPPDWKLREKLEKKPCAEIFKMLQKLNPKRARIIDKKNKRRLIRAIEISISSPRANFSSRRAVNEYDILYISIAHPPEILKKRIEKRLDTRLKQGLLKEVENLRREKKLSWKRLNELGLEYRYISYFLRGQIQLKKELIKKLKTEIWRYAKRQMTWFSAHGGSASGGKKDKKIRWIKNQKKAEELVRRFISAKI